MRVLPVLLLVHALLAASVSAIAQLQRNEEELGVSGYVLAPDGTPVSGGTVTIQGATTSIERTGRFRLVPNASGLHELSVSVAGLAPYRVRVTVPPSRTLRLPVIRLSPATYFRVRFVSADGEPITSPRLVRRSLDVRGALLSGPPDGRTSDEIDADGTTTIGPLPRGVTTLALDTPLVAQTRLRDLHVTGETALLDGGTVIVQPGAVLHVDVVDGAGAPMPGHDVFLEDALPLSPLAGRSARTDHQGRATFDRLATGRYHVRTRTEGLCGNRRVSIARTVSMAGNGALHTRLVVGGRAAFRITSSFGPLRAIVVSASADSIASPQPAWLRGPLESLPFLGRPLRPFTLESFCSGTTDGDGRVTLINFPPGPARVEVRLLNSTWVGRVNVPSEGREHVIEIPPGYLPLRVTNARTGRPVGGAAITWTGGGARVEATASGNGEALVAGVAAAAGTLAIRAPGYEPEETKFSEPPAALHEVALVPVPDLSVQGRVIAASGQPLPNAVVELRSEDPIEVGHVAVTDANGVVRFLGVPSGAVRLTAGADGFVIAATRVSQDARTGVVLTLSRGYRVTASVESSIGTGQHLIRIVNDTGASMDALLDLASDRSIEPPGRMSLGPLPPGTYLVQLHGRDEHRQERVRIVDRDVHVTFR